MQERIKKYCYLLHLFFPFGICAGTAIRPVDGEFPRCENMRIQLSAWHFLHSLRHTGAIWLALIQVVFMLAALANQTVGTRASTIGTLSRTFNVISNCTFQYFFSSFILLTILAFLPTRQKKGDLPHFDNSRSICFLYYYY